MAKNTSFPPIKDGVKADNSTYSSNQIDKMVSEIESEIPVLPDPAVEDINKVIGITSDGSTGAEYGLIAIENELPTPEVADIGKLAGVVSDGSTGAEYGLVNAPDPVFNPPIFKVKYSTTDAKYMYYSKNNQKLTWDQFFTDISGLPFWILALNMNDDPNAPLGVSNYVHLYPERDFIDSEYVKEYYFDNVFRGNNNCYHIAAHISWLSWNPDPTTVTITPTKLENAS